MDYRLPRCLAFALTLVCVPVLVFTQDKAPAAVTAKGSPTLGKLVIEPRFDWAGPFNEGRTAVLVGDATTGKWGYISR